MAVEAHGNNKPELHGLRKMVAESRLLPLEVGSLPSQREGAQRTEAANTTVAWHVRRSYALRDINRDSSVLTEGSATVIGLENIRPGRDLRLTRGDLVSEHYMTRASHNIGPLDGWTTTLALERGTDFAERLRMSGSTYNHEGRRGPYSP